MQVVGQASAREVPPSSKWVGSKSPMKSPVGGKRSVREVPVHDPPCRP
jgi:hypothetical protein